MLRRDAVAPSTAAALDSATATSAASAAGEQAKVDAASYTIKNIKTAYGIPTDLSATNDATLQMVWGPGTFGYSPASLKKFAREQVMRCPPALTLPSRPP